MDCGECQVLPFSFHDLNILRTIVMWTIVIRPAGYVILALTLHVLHLQLLHCMHSMILVYVYEVEAYL